MPALQQIDGNECKVCENGEAANGPDDVACGDGSPEQSCYTCKDGKCGNQCEASENKQTFESTMPQFVAEAISGFTRKGMRQCGEALPTTSSAFWPLEARKTS